MVRSNYVAAGIALVLLAGIPPAEAAVAWAPVAVVAGHASADDTSVALVAWVRGYEAADFYRVYGVDGSALTFLAVETDFVSSVPAGYSAYGVSGVRDGVESEVVLAEAVPCVSAALYPPPAVSAGECRSQVGIRY